MEEELQRLETPITDEDADGITDIDFAENFSIEGTPFQPAEENPTDQSLDTKKPSIIFDPRVDAKQTVENIFHRCSSDSERFDVGKSFLT